MAMEQTCNFGVREATLTSMDKLYTCTHNELRHNRNKNNIMVQNIPGILAIWIKWASTKSYSDVFIQQRTSWIAKNIVLTLFQV